MQFKSPLIAAACAVVLSLTACGGGSGDNSSTTPVTAVASPSSLVITDNTVGTGAEAIKGKKITVAYSGWLYSATASDNKGAHFETSIFTFTLGAGTVIAGWDQGLVGMKVGGKRTLQIPSNLAYGNVAYSKIPAGSGLVFEVVLNGVE